MNESIFIWSFSLIYLVITYILHRLLLRAEIVKFAILAFLNFIVAYLLFDGAVRLYEYLRDHKTYLQFGHADEVLVEIFLLWIVIAVINIVIVLIRRSIRKKRQPGN